MLAPCIIVLSTSKKAAAFGSAGMVSAFSTSAAAAAASPARVERCWRSSRRRFSGAVTLALYRRRAAVGAEPLCEDRPHARDSRRVLARRGGGGRSAADVGGRGGRRTQRHVG